MIARWERLTEPWRCCLEEAWAAYRAGSKPIGAAIVDHEGRVVARGRNHIGDDAGLAGQINRHTLAHAEVNALLALQRPSAELHAYVLYTTTEPCPLCFGAFYMSGLRELHYLARDPWAGSTDLLGATPYLRRKPIRVVGPEIGHLETILVAMHVESDLSGGWASSADFRACWEAVLPAGMALGTALHQSGELRRLRDAGALVAAVLDALEAYLPDGDESRATL